MNYSSGCGPCSPSTINREMRIDYTALRSLARREADNRQASCRLVRMLDLCLTCGLRYQSQSYLGSLLLIYEVVLVVMTLSTDRQTAYIPCTHDQDWTARSLWNIQGAYQPFGRDCIVRHSSYEQLCFIPPFPPEKGIIQANITSPTLDEIQNIF